MQILTSLNAMPRMPMHAVTMHIYGIHRRGKHTLNLAYGSELFGPLPASLSPNLLPNPIKIVPDAQAANIVD